MYEQILQNKHNMYYKKKKKKINICITVEL